MHQIDVNGLVVDVVRKDIKNLHLAVYPPHGRVRVAAPCAWTCCPPGPMRLSCWPATKSPRPPNSSLTGRPDLRCKKCDRGLLALLECREFKDYMLWVYHCPKCEQNYMVNVDKNRKIPIVRYLTDVLQDGLEKHSQIIMNTKDMLVEYPHPEEILWVK